MVFRLHISLGVVLVEGEACEPGPLSRSRSSAAKKPDSSPPHLISSAVCHPRVYVLFCKLNISWLLICLTLKNVHY